MHKKINKDNVEDLMSLSSLQEGILFHCISEPDRKQYLEQLSLTLTGIINIERIKATWKILSENNEMLRTVFRWKGLEQPIQIVLKKNEIPIDVLDLSIKDMDDQQKLLKEIKETDRKKKIDITEEPFRVTLGKIEETKYEMIITYHHILYDGWSTGILLKEFFGIYEKLSGGLQPTKIEKNKYKEFIKWCNRRDVVAQKNYWEKYLENLNTNSFTSKNFIVKDKYQSNLIKKSYSLPSTLVGEIEEFCKKKMVTMATLLYTGWGILLGKYNNTRDVVFGTTISGRPPEISGIEDMVGLFINTLPLRLKTEGSATVINLLESVDNMLKERTAYENTPLVDIQQYSSISNGQLFDSIIAVENYPINQLLKRLDGDIKVRDFSMEEETNYPITFSVTTFDGIDFNIAYQTFNDDWVLENILDHYVNIISVMISKPNIEISKINMLSKEENRILIEGFNNTKVDYSREKTLHQLFEEQVEKTPNKIAVVFEEKSLTYRELNEKANQLARILRQKGVEADTIVGIMVERSLEMMVGIWAILKAGGAYLPIDPNYPEDRIGYMLEDSGAALLLIQQSLMNSIQFKGEMIAISHEDTRKEDTANLEHITKSSNLAYVIYTSGSTGKPKGNLTMHYNVVRLLKNTNYIEVTPEDTILQLSNYAFDGSVFDIYTALTNGAKLVLVSKKTASEVSRLSRVIKEEHVSVFFVTTALFNVLVDVGIDCFQRIRKVLFGGERVSVQHAKKALEYMGPGRIVHVYGPTESTVYATYYEINHINTDAVTVPIGRPLSNTEIYITDLNMSLQPVGVEGEIWIAGDGLARGYLNKPGLTAEKFVDNPFIKEGKVYKTGDLARWLPDGNIEFLGRTDHQVKIRGFRIELGEIENLLLSHRAINEAIVLAKDNNDGSKYLCGYITGNQEVDIEEIKSYLSKELPEHMIPPYILHLDKMPLTPNGKIDSRRLPDPDEKFLAMVEYEAPRNEIEDKLSKIWSRILAVEKVGINDNFFDLGGHSLKVTVLVSKIHKELNVEVPISEVFKRPTIKNLAELIADTHFSDHIEIKKVPEKECYEVSSAQKRVFMLQQFDLQSTVYNISSVMEVQGKLELEKLESAINKLIERHESLRTSFENIDGDVVQKIHKDSKLEIQYIDNNFEGDHKNLINFDIEINDMIHQFIRPFDLREAPLFRVGVIKISQNKNILMFDMHHIISDGVSTGILVDEFTKLYEGKELKGLEIQYKDFSAWQNKNIKSEKNKAAEEYWVNRFSDEIPVLNLPLDFKRPKIQSFEGDCINFVLDSDLKDGLNKIAKETDSTIYMVLLSIVNILLSKYSGQEDIIVGSPIAGRQHPQLEELIGMFVNTLAMRNAPEGEKIYSEFLKEVKANALKAYENQDYQFEELVEKLNLKRDLSRNPLFDVMFTMQNMNHHGIELENLKFNPYNNKNSLTKFDMTFIATEIDQGIEINLEYCTKLFKRETIKKISKQFIKIAKDIAKGTNIKLKELSILLEEEKQKLFYDFNDTYKEYQADKRIHQLFEEQVERTPNNIALVFGDEQLTYKELNEKVNQLANYLVDKGIKTNMFVGVMIEKSVETVIATLSILKAGGAYVPLDPMYPEERLSVMIQELDIRYVLTDEDTKTKIHKVDTEFICLDKDSKDISQKNKRNLNIKINDDSLIYVIYTSGSTGTPKGAGVYHRSFVNLLNWYITEFDISEGDTNFLVTSPNFDLTQKNLFASIVTGGKLCIPILKHYDHNYTINEIEDKKVTIINCTPSMFYKLLEFDEGDLAKLSSLRCVFLGGEPISMPILKKWITTKHFNGEIINTYGPTECTDICAFYRIKEPLMFMEKPIPVGKPINNVQLYVLDKDKNPVPVGVDGELYISGDGVGIGYLNDEELTINKFTKNHLTNINDERLYQTGDVVRWLPDGNIEFLGRTDHQVKIRGFRIEIGEIEKVLSSHHLINEVIVVAIDGEKQEKYLCAYIVGETPLDIAEVRDFISKQLPEYMIPLYFIQLDKMPLNINGKIDRKALPKPDGDNIVKATKYEAPRNAMEEKLADIWSATLGIVSIGINDDFFDLGGHSLKVTGLVSKIHKEFNVEVPISEVFKRPTIKELSTFIKDASYSKYQALEKIEEREYYEVSSAQKRMYMLQQFDLQSTGYNMPSALEIEGELDLNKLEVAINKLIKRHESLRTSFKTIDGEVVQKVSKDAKLEIEYIDKSIDGDYEISMLINRFIRPFDLSKCPLLRVGVIKISENKNILMFDLHHIISDGMSTGILVDEFTKLYEGKQLKELKIQYKDFSVWQNQYLKSQKMKDIENYWLNKFSDETPVLNLPVDYKRPKLQSFEGNSINFTLDKDLKNGLNKISKETDTTMYMVILSAFTILLSKYSGQEDIIVGSPIAGRTHEDLNSIMGMFVNTLAMRNYPKGDQNFNEFLIEVKNNALEAYENQDYQFEELVEKLNLRRDISRNPLFDVVFTMQNMDIGQLSIEGLNIKSYHQENNISKFDITLSAIETNDSLDITMEYATKIFKRETIERFGRHLENILRQIVKNLEVKISDLELISEEEKRQLLENDISRWVSYPKNKTIHQLFEEQVQRTPENIAVICGNESITYSELNKKANQIARLLVIKGVKAETIVGIMVGRTIEMIIGIIAILKAGGAYLPIDPEYPMDRIRYILEDSGANILLTQSWIKAQMDFKGESILLDDPQLYLEDDTDLVIGSNPSNIAYIIYTSGSTGKPKGVMVEHRNVVRLMINDQNLFSFSSHDVWTMFHSFCFDFSVWEMYGALLYGGKLVMISKLTAQNPGEYLKVIKKERVTVLNQTPTAFYNLVNQELMSAGAEAECIRYIIFGGEALKPSNLKPWREKYPHTKLINMYGITETTVHVTYKEITELEIETNVSNIGRPIPTLNTYVIDKNMKLAPIGVPGELCVGGEGVARGYLNRKELTEERFIQNPYKSEERIYRSGDLVKLLPEGDLEYLGRIDHQVKIRGHRIELGEIENSLLRHEDIKDAVIVVKDDYDGGNDLYGYITANKKLTVSEVRDYLAKELPHYMIPSFIIQLEEMPLTSNGKVDRKALPEPDGHISTKEEYEAPKNEIEEILVGIWEEILNVKQLGINHDFFELGGHSLKAIALTEKIHKALEVEVPLGSVFSNPTIKLLGEYINEINKKEHVAIEAIAEEEYYPVSSAQRRIYIQEQYNQDSTAYNMTAALILEGDLNHLKLEEVINQLIERHEALRTSFKMIKGLPMQKIEKNIRINISCVEVKEEELSGFTDGFTKSFDLTKAPLFRVSLLKLGELKYLLLFDLHHIISDGISMNILTRDFISLYEGKNLPALRIQYKDFVAWHNSLLESERMKELENYWINKLETYVETNLPLKSTLSQGVKSNKLQFLIEEELREKINEFCVKYKVTKAVFILAVFKLLIGKTINQNEITVGIPVAGRRHEELENIMGIFLNVLLFSSYIPYDGTFLDYLKKLAADFMEAQENQDYPYELIHEKATEKLITEDKSLFSILYNYMPYQVEDQLHISGLDVKPYPLQEPEAKYSLTLYVKESKSGLVLEAVYDHRVDEYTVENILSQLPITIKEIMADNEISISKFISTQKLQDQFEEESGKVFDNVDVILEKFALTTPNKVAIERGKEKITYKELEEKTNKIANFLIEKGGNIGNVPVMFENSIELVEAILGVVKAGGVFAPVDPNFPSNRINYMLDEIEADWIITQSEWLFKLDELLDNQKRNLNTLVLDSCSVNLAEFSNLTIYTLEDILKKDATKVTNSINTDCYIYFTSGSTGKPKGILGRHTSLMHFIDWEIREFDVKDHFRVGQLTSPSFDPFLRDTFVPLCIGATLCIPETREIVMNPRALIRWMDKEKITLVHMVPTLFKAMMKEIEDSNHFKELKYILLAGELLRGNDIKNFIKHFGKQTELINLYGPTETTLAKFFYRIQESDIERTTIPVGKPINGAQALILNNRLRNLGIGSIGEIYIRTPYMSSGYYNNEDLTREVFIKNPFTNDSKEIIYKTGDIGRLLTSGDLEIMGRVDHQVKIRGFRIEIGEIENRLLQYEGIKEAVAVAREMEGEGKSLWGYITGENPPKMEEIKEYLSKELPDYMIPAFIIHLAEMPLTPNGKVDRKVLPGLEGSIIQSTKYIPPRNNIEKELVKIWQEILGVEGISIEDDFFSIGGHSLKATSMTVKIHKNLNAEVPLKVIFKNPTVKGIAEFIEEAEISNYNNILPIEERAYYPVSSAQRRIYTLQQLDKGGVGYNIPVAYMLEGKLDLGKLEVVFKELIARQESLRTSFSVVDGEIVQIVHRNVDFKIEYLKENQENIETLLKDFVKPFQMEMAPLFRVGLVKLDHEKHLLIFDIHHVISDGTSMGILIKEFAELYRDMTIEPLRIQYKDYSQWQNELINSGRIEGQKKYWLSRFEGEIPVLNLVEDYPRPAIQSFEGHRLNYKLEAELTRELREFCKENGATLYMVLLSVYNVLLSKYSGQEDIIVGTPIAGRSHADLSNIIGMFVNTLAMRNYPKADKTFREFLTEVKDHALGAYENQDYQFEELVENLNLRRDLSRNPLFDTMFITQNIEISPIELEDLTIQQFDLNKTVSKFDMTLIAVETEMNINIGIEYATKIFKKETIERLYTHFKNILKQIIESPDTLLSEVELITEEERKQIVEDFNNTKEDYPKDKTIHQLFEEQVEKTPNRIAVIFEGSNMTYRQLNEKANQLARLLVDKGVKADSIVGIMVDRSLEMMIGIMAILKAGGAYLPIDPAYPMDRIEYILEDSGASLLLSQSWLLEKIGFNGEILSLDEEHLYNGNNSNLSIELSSTSLAYIIYTSGSTGKPKGVMIQHYSLINRLNWMQKEYPIGEEDVILQKTPFTFDVSLWELFWWSIVGAKVAMLEKGGEKNPKQILEAIEKNKITTMHFVPSMLSAFLEYMENIEDKYCLNSLRQVFASGEAISKNQVELFYKLIGNKNQTNLINLYGPTEATVDVSYFNCKGSDLLNNIPIGKPIDNINLYIVDPSFKLLPIGVAGELCISGAGLARGYLNRPELTDEKFVGNPFKEEEKMYRTGDLVRWLPDGNIEFLGRIDHQVKIRGYRIELGEIENQLINYKSIEGAVVIEKEDETGSKYLCGYIVAKEDVVITDLKQALLKKLPEYMVPSYILQLEHIPLTSNGKIDRKSLPEPDGNMSTMVEYEAPRNEIEKTLIDIWEEILGIEGIGINHNFFEAGGHSLKATAMVARIQKIFNVEVPLRDIFEKPTIRDIAEIIEEAEESLYSGIKVVEEKEYYGTSPAQRRLYALQQFDKDSLGYNMSVALLLEGSLDVGKLKNTFVKLLERHEILRTSFNIVDGEPMQFIHKEVDFDLQYMKAGEEEIDQIHKNFIKPFDLSNQLQLRVGLFEISVEKHLLIIDMHHIVSDGVSMGIIVEDFTQLYKGINLEPLRIQYKDYSEWQNELITSGKIEGQKKYWLKQLEGEVPVLDLVGDYPRPVIQSFEGNRLIYKLDNVLTTGLRKICNETATTMYMVLLSAFNVLLSKYSRQEDIIIGSPIAGRSHGDLSNIIGMFVNTLAMRNYPKGEKTFKEFLEEVKKNALDAYENQDFQFEELVEHLNLRRDLSRNPLFDVMFTMQNMDLHDLDIGELSIKPYIFKKNISKFDITLSAEEEEKEINVGIEYSTKIFKKETIERLYVHLKNILVQIINNSEMKLSEIQLATEVERLQILKDFNNTIVEYPKDKTVHQLFEEQVKKTPNKLAVVFENKSLTYQELNERANQLARVLLDHDVKPDTMVGIMVERSLEMVIGIMAILKSGGAYLPIDPDYPQDRINYMLEDGSCKIVLIQDHLRDRGNFKGKLVISLDDPNMYRDETSNVVIESRPTDLAYVIYTSGSTGKPKGVMIEHRSVVRLVKNTNYVEFREDDKILQTGAIVFDAITFELWGALLNGLELHLVDLDVILDAEKLQKTMIEKNITILWLTVSLFNQLVQQSVEIFEPLRYLLVGGDALTPKFINLVRNRYPQINIINGYGPTENTTFSTCFRIDGEYINNIPIGGPIANSTGYVLDGYNKLQPIGVVGELCLGGDGLARGYLNRADLTTEKFVNNPFVEGERMYRTGDLVRWLPNGTIEFLGRIDHQVKIRGFRIELGEIENKLAHHPEVKEAVVLAKENKDGSKYLCSYITGEEKVDIGEVKKYLSKDLPEYMIPSYILKLDKMPLTPNGKVDRKALPEPDGNIITATVEYEAPRNETDHTLVDIWQKILGHEKIGINDNFFEVGGNSINIIKIANEIEKRLDVKFSIANLYLNTTIKDIADNVYKETILNDLECIVKLNKSTSKKNIFLIHGYDGDVFYYKDLAKLLEKDYTVYGIQSKGFVKDSKLPNSIEEMLGDYLEEMKMIQPEGPYLIGGFCVGVMLGYEMTRMLEDAGEEVEKLLLIDGMAFIDGVHLKVINQKENLSKGGFIKKIADRTLDKLLDLVLNNMQKREYSNDREFEVIKQTDIGDSALDHARIKKNIGTIVYRKYLPRRKINTPIGVIKAMENHDSRINKEKWEKIVNATVDFYESPGNHETMLLEPNVELLAERVREVLKKCCY